MAANALIALSTAGTMDSDKTSTSATNASLGNGNITAEPSEHIDNKAGDAVKPPKQGVRKFVLKLGSRKRFEEKQSEDSAKTSVNSSGKLHEAAAANALVWSATSHVVDSDRATKADLESRYIASMLRKGDMKIFDDALKLLKQAVKEFVHDQLEKTNVAPRVEVPVQPVKRESPWARLPPVPKQVVEGERDLIRERRQEFENQGEDEKKKRLREKMSRLTA